MRPYYIAPPTNGFLRELRCIDPRYYPEYSPDDGYWLIICPIKDQFGERGEIKGRYHRLNDSALTDMRRRKRVGVKLNGDMKKYVKWLKADQAREQRRLITEAQEMQAEGFVRIHNWETDKRPHYFT